MTHQLALRRAHPPPTEMLMDRKPKRPVFVAVNERGFRIGETHHNAKLSDALVDQIRDLFEYEGLRVGEICEKLGLAKTTVVKIIRYERRVSTPDRWKKIDGKSET